jgi:hypothetical protein
MAKKMDLRLHVGAELKGRQYTHPLKKPTKHEGLRYPLTLLVEWMVQYALRSVVSRSQRHHAVFRAFDFLECRENELAISCIPATPALDCDWMLGAAVTAQAYADHSPQITQRAAAMASRLCSHQQLRPSSSPENLLSSPLATLRRTVLDKFATMRALSVQSTHHWQIHPRQECTQLLAQLQQQTLISQHTVFHELFGFCPLDDVPPSPNEIAIGDRTRWSHGLIFARMAEELKLNEALHQSPSIRFPSFEECLRWIRQALPPVPPLPIPIGREETRTDLHALSPISDPSFFWSERESARLVRKEEWYLRTHIVYTQAGYQHAGGFYQHASPVNWKGEHGDGSDDMRALRCLLRHLLHEAKTRSAGGTSDHPGVHYTGVHYTHRWPDMVGEALDCLKTGHAQDSACAAVEGVELVALVQEAESFLLDRQQADGGWLHDEGTDRRHHATWVAIWGLRDSNWPG